MWMSFFKTLTVAVALSLLACSTRPSSNQDSGAADADTSDGGKTIDAGLVSDHFRAPQPGVVERSLEIRAAHASAHVEISGRSGTVQGVWLRLRADTPELGPTEIQPLERTLGTNRASMATAMHTFFSRFANVWALGVNENALEFAFDKNNPERNLNLALDPQNPELADFEHAESKDGLRTVRLVQTLHGVRILGRYAIGAFDRDGNLFGLWTRLFPLPSLSEPPAFNPTDAMAVVMKEAQAIATLNPRLRWVRGALSSSELEQSAEQLWLPNDANDVKSPLTLAWEVTLRDGGRLARIRIDATTRGILKAFDETASEGETWYTHGVVETVAAPDETGAIHSIPSTIFGGQRTMGIGHAFQFDSPLDEPPFAAGTFFQISNAQASEDLDPGVLYADPIAGPASNTWETDAAYSQGNAKSATGLMRNLVRALKWWQEPPRNWRGWDDRGSTLWGGVNRNPNDPDSEGKRPLEFNAWGGGGTVTIGDGMDRQGRTTSASLEVIGHELMHNIIDATSRLAYHDEPGAINEALADFYGMALTVVSDDFATNDFGDDNLEFFRDVVDPARQGRPDRYSRYVGTTADSGGVHTNSAIISKALSLLVRPGLSPFNGVSVTPVGFARTDEILRTANVLRAYDPESTMEEFAAAVVGTCDLVHVLNYFALGPDDPVITSGTYERLCTSYRQAFQATETLPGSLDADLALTSIRFGTLNVSAYYNRLIFRVENRGLANSVDLSDYQIEVRDELGETSLIPFDPGEVSWGFGNQSPDGNLLPGGSANIQVPLDPLTLDPLGASTRRTIRDLTISVAPKPDRPRVDVDLSNNRMRFRPGPDYLAPFATWRAESGNAGFSASLYNRSRLGLPSGLRLVAFERSTARGPLRLLSASSTEVVLANDETTGTNSPLLALGAGSVLDIRPPNIPLSSAYPYATGIPGLATGSAVTFDSMGGLSELEGQRQIYVLVDADDRISEFDERGNLLCVNCVPGSGSPGSTTGVVVLLSPLTDISALFPAPYRTAAARLVPPLPKTVPSESEIGVSIGSLRYRGRAPRAAPRPTPDPPTITDVTPRSGPVGAGVLIHGLNLSGATAVAFNGVSASIGRNTATLIETLVPTGATTGPVSVTTAGGTAMTLYAFTIVAGGAPIIQNIDPDGGPIGSELRVLGNQLATVTSVVLEGTSLPIVSASTFEVRATVQAGATSGFVTVTNPMGSTTSSEPFSITPEITGISTTSAICNRTVAITGNHFFNIFEVRVGGKLVSSHSVPSYTSIEFVPGCGEPRSSGPITVLNAGGTATSTGSLTVLPRS